MHRREPIPSQFSRQQASLIPAGSPAAGAGGGPGALLELQVFADAAAADCRQAGRGGMGLDAAGHEGALAAARMAAA